MKHPYLKQHLEAHPNGKGISLSKQEVDYLIQLIDGDCTPDPLLELVRELRDAARIYRHKVGYLGIAVDAWDLLILAEKRADTSLAEAPKEKT